MVMNQGEQHAMGIFNFLLDGKSSEEDQSAINNAMVEVRKKINESQNKVALEKDKM